MGPGADDGGRAAASSTSPSHKRFEPLLLVPIGFGALLATSRWRASAAPDGVLDCGAGGDPPGMIGMIYTDFYTVGVETGIFPLVIFMGVGAHDRLRTR
jgi:Na+-transporting methylmalonyl-CoA/oxaloacetate decarboxylase beta subunit